MMKTTIGLDLGTSGVRAVVLDCATGELCHQVSQPVSVRAAGDQFTADAAEIVASVVSVLQQTPVELARTVAAMSFSVQGEAFVPVDSAGQPLDRVPLSMDRRGASQVDRMSTEVGAEEFARITGQPLNQMFPIFKIAAEDGRWAADRYLGLGDYVLTQLGGRGMTDWTQAARTGMFDVENCCWTTVLVQAMGLERLPSRLAVPVPAGTVAGTLSAEMAAATGLPAGLQLVVGMHDQAAAFVGAGGSTDIAVVSLGTSECLTVGSSKRPDVAETGLASYPASPDLWLTLAGTAAGGWALDWLARLVGVKDLSQRAALFDAPSAELAAVLVLPYFTGSGTLDNDPTATGTITGLGLDTTTDQLVRALYESSGYELAKIRGALADQIAIHAVHATGSGSANRAAVQIRSDAFDLPLTPVEPQAAARGAALIAASGIGQPVAAQQQSSSAVIPNPDHRAHHHTRRAMYHQLYQAVSAVSKSQP